MLTNVDISAEQTVCPPCSTWSRAASSVTTCNNTRDEQPLPLAKARRAPPFKQGTRTGQQRLSELAGDHVTPTPVTMFLT